MYRKIVVTLDGSTLSESVLPHVEAFRKGFPDCEVVFLFVVESLYDALTSDAVMIDPEEFKAMENGMVASAEAYLEKVIGRLAQGGAPVRTQVMIGRVGDSIVNHADEEKVDAIFMATHGRSGVSRWVMGSVADRVLRSANVPVFVVRADGKKAADV